MATKFKLIRVAFPDFELPGLSNNPHGPATLTVALAFAYSRRWNRRRLEHHTYAFWDQVFCHLIYDLQPYLFHIPQLVIHNSPTELPNLSIRTDPRANGDEKIPDFTVMGVNAMHRFKTSDRENPHFPTLENWNRLVINSAKPFIITELKRPPPRSVSLQKFRIKLKLLMRMAMNGADEQAQLAFGVSLYGEDFKSVILIAACGEWWTFKLATKIRVEQGSYDVLSGLYDNGEADSDNDKVSYESHSSHGKTKSQRIGSQATVARRHTTVDPDEMAVLQDNVEDAMPATDEWSEYILFGTQASNQRLFLIHRWLEVQRGDVGVPYADSVTSEVRLPTNLQRIVSYSVTAIPFLH